MDWFRRFGDIPGVVFDCAPGVEPKRLPGHGAVPTAQTYTFEGKRLETLTWPGGGSASPAHGRAFRTATEESPPALLKNCYEGLELPGEPSDYHFLIQGCAKDLWGWRRRDADALEDVRRLCWLDLQLIDARPDAIAYESNGGQQFASVLAFSILIDMYEREGFLHEALEVAERAARYNQAGPARDRLAKRIAAVESEDEG